MRPRTVNKFRRNLVIAGSSLLVNGALIFGYINFGKTENAYGSTMTTAAGGAWNSAATWSSARIPASNDTITIPAGKMVVITDMTPLYTSMKIIVYGTLHINGGKKLNMCNGIIDIRAGGEIEGDNTGSMVDMCSNFVWNGSMPGEGPMQITGNTVLPVELAYFKAEGTTNGTVNIFWQTASEVNCDYFSIERSADGKKFETITEVDGGGNSNTALQYSYLDMNPSSPVSYYRLKQVDFDGKSETFNVVSVNPKPQRELVVYPNPALQGETVTVQVPAESEKSIQVFVTDIQGKQIFTKSFEKENATDNTIRFVTEKFPATGTYFITASGVTNTYLKKIVVQ